MNWKACWNTVWRLKQLSMRNKQRTILNTLLQTSGSGAQYNRHDTSSSFCSLCGSILYAAGISELFTSLIQALKGSVQNWWPRLILGSNTEILGTTHLSRTHHSISSISQTLMYVCLSVPSTDSSNGSWKVCRWAPYGQEIYIDSCGQATGAVLQEYQCSEANAGRITLTVEEKDSTQTC